MVARQSVIGADGLFEGLAHGRSPVLQQLASFGYLQTGDQLGFFRINVRIGSKAVISALPKSGRCDLGPKADPLKVR